MDCWQVTFTCGIVIINRIITSSHADIKNSLRQTAANETTSATKYYDAFGNPTTSTGTWHGPFQYGANFGYQTDADSGLKLLGHRYYDSSTGRFLSRHPIKDGKNWFAYAGSSPTGSADPNGYVVIIMAAVIGIVGLFALFWEFGKLFDRAMKRKKSAHDAVAQEEDSLAARGLDPARVDQNLVDTAYRPNLESIAELREIAYDAAIDQYVKEPLRQVHASIDLALGIYELISMAAEATRALFESSSPSSEKWKLEYNFNPPKDMKR